MKTADSTLGDEVVRGLLRCTAALAGRDVEEVCAALRRSPTVLPWPAAHLWAAAAPAGVAPPADEAAVLARFLIGAERDATRVGAAWRVLRASAGREPDWTPIDADEDLVAALWRRALREAVREHWSLLADAYRRARLLVVAGDARGAARVLDAVRVPLQPVDERIALLAGRVGGSAGAAPGRPWFPPHDGAHDAAPGAAHDGAPGGAPGGAPDGAPSPPLDRAPSAVAAPGITVVPPPPVAVPPPPDATGRDRARGVARRAEHEREGDERGGDEVEFRRVREHRVLPVLFLLVALAVAVGLLYGVTFVLPTRLD